MHTSASPDRQSPEPDQFLSLSRVAGLLDVHVSTVRRWIAAGRLPAYRVGDKGIRVRYGDILALLTSVQSSGENEEAIVSEERVVASPLTAEEQQRGLRLLDELAQLRAEDLSRRGGRPYPNSADTINDLRDQRTHELMRTDKE